MPDTYRDFAHLAVHEKQDEDFSVRFLDTGETLAIVAPHGGGIEPGTSEIAEAIAGNEFSFYAFDGLKDHGNSRLHITSTRFDEPNCLALVQRAAAVISIHGEESEEEEIVFIGGLDEDLANRVTDSLARMGFRVERHRNPGLQGRDRRNICNRGKSGMGIQLELSQGLRRSFFRSLSREGRQIRTKRFADFVAGVRNAIRCAMAAEQVPKTLD